MPNIIPKTFLIDKPNQSILEEYIEIFPTGIVIKPLNLCGGEGVQMYNGRNFDYLNLDDSQYIIQEFIKEVYEGDKRIIIKNSPVSNIQNNRNNLNGKICSASSK